MRGPARSRYLLHLLASLKGVDGHLANRQGNRI